MSGPFKRSDWNAIIDKINALSSTCNDTVTPLDHVDVNHRWSKQDIIDARNKITEHCNNVTFTADLIKWTQKIIDELNAAIDDCDCKGGGGEYGCVPCSWDHGVIPGGYLIPKSIGYDLAIDMPPHADVATELNEVELCDSGYLGRGFVFCWDSSDPDQWAQVGGCSIDCNGRVRFPCQTNPSDVPWTLFCVGYCTTSGICDENMMFKTKCPN